MQIILGFLSFLLTRQREIKQELPARFESGLGKLMEETFSIVSNRFTIDATSCAVRPSTIAFFATSIILPRSAIAKGGEFFLRRIHAFSPRRRIVKWEGRDVPTNRRATLDYFFFLSFSYLFLFLVICGKKTKVTQTQSWEKSTPRKGPGCPFFFFNWSHARIKRVRETTRVCVRVCVRGCAVQNRNKDGQGIDKREKRGCRGRIVSNRSLPGCYLYISRLLRVFFFCSSHRLSLSLSLSYSLPAISLSLSVSLSSSSALRAWL